MWKMRAVLGFDRFPSPGTTKNRLSSLERERLSVMGPGSRGQERGPQITLLALIWYHS